ncbi:hypothetical protein HZY83_07320 [Gemella sp. GH3]|uniref:hypothetical protein n=1 Tax=unclassified Gemella TaxID=2624949 RepID=UPI0015D02F33|nr:MULTISPECIES: hypothetical protein [unclassified Gemella]MBF0714483.1 hypothetical protein [Gemella sp. GH3.1]NYS51435.1 hypothetical protein [Gemella sp. GH3]
MTITEVVALVSVIIAFITLAINFKNRSDEQLIKIDKLEHIAKNNEKIIEKQDIRIQRLEDRDDVIIRLDANLESITKKVDILDKKFDRTFLGGNKNG